MGFAVSKRIFFSITLVLLFSIGWAQSNLVFYNSYDQVNAPNLNPSFLSGQEKFVLSVLPISGISVGYNDQKVINGMILDVLKGRQTNEKFKEVFRSLLGTDLFFQRLEIPILSLGYNSKWGSFNFRIKDNMRMMTDLNGEVSDFLSNPESLTVQLNKMQEFPIHAMYYREYSVGYAKEIVPKKLSIGLRAKAYFGKFSIISDVKGEASLGGDGNYYFRTWDQMKMSFPAKIILDGDNNFNTVTTADDFTFGSFMFNSRNVGAGIDIGIDYRLNSDISFSASVTDVGQIKWKNNLNSMDYIGDYLFDPQYINDAESNDQQLTRKANFPATSEEIPSLFRVENNLQPYSTSMPISIYAGMKYRVTQNLEIGLVDRYIKSDKMGYNSFLISGFVKVKPSLDLITGYGMIGPSLFNIPLAVVKSGNAGQFFIGTDNILALATNNSDLAGISFGASVFLSPKGSNRETQIDYLPFFNLKKKRIR